MKLLEKPCPEAAIANAIRNPLAAIRLQVEYLRDQTDGLDPQRDSLTQTLDEIERVDKSVEAVLDFGERVQINLQHANLSEIMENASQPLLNKAESLGIVLRREGFARTIPCITDPYLLEKIIGRLLQNALEASAAGQETEIYCDQGGRFMEITLLDHGIGMSAEELRCLGEPYFSNKAKGLGLGVHLAIRDVERLGGSIEFRSQPQQGTTVKIKLPKQDRK